MIARSRALSLSLVLLALFGAQARLVAAHQLPAVAVAREAKPVAVPTPREVLGFAPGDDRKLADWSQIVDYFKRLDSASPRVSVHQAGVTTEQRPFIIAIISSEENINNLPRIREAQRKLADPRLISNNEER